MRDLESRIGRFEAEAQARRQPEPSALFDAIADEMQAYGAAKASMGRHFAIDATGRLAPLQLVRSAYAFDPAGPSLFARYCRDVGAPLPALRVQATEIDHANC